MNRRTTLISVCLLAVVLVVCGYMVWDRVELPRIIYNNFTFVKVKTLTFNMFDSEMGSNFYRTDEQIDGYSVYVPVTKQSKSSYEGKASYLVTEIVFKKGSDKFVV